MNKPVVGINGLVMQRNPDGHSASVHHVRGLSLRLALPHRRAGYKIVENAVVELLAAVQAWEMNQLQLSKRKPALSASVTLSGTFFSAEQTKAKCAPVEETNASWDYLKKRLAETGLMQG